MYTDASQYAIGGYLTQKDPESGLEITLGVYSEGLKESYHTRSAFERELYAAYSSTRNVIAYLHGRNFTLYSDNFSSVRACMNDIYNSIYAPSTQTQLQFIKEKNGTIKHLSRVANVVADMLARINPQISLNDIQLKGNVNKTSAKITDLSDHDTGPSYDQNNANNETSQTVINFCTVNNVLYNYDRLSPSLNARYFETRL